MKKLNLFFIVGIFLIFGLFFISALTTTNLFFDGFEGGGYDLTTLWTANAGYVQSSTQAATGTFSIEIDGSVTDALMTITGSENISSYTSCNLTADLWIDSQVDGNEYICMDYSLDNGTTWNRDTTTDGIVGGLCQDGNVDAENAFRLVSHYISSPNGTDYFKYRFRSTISAPNEDAYIDNVNLNCSTNTAPTFIGLNISDTTIKGGNTITIFANTSIHLVNDTEVDTLFLYCDESTTPTAANTDCTGGTTSDSTYPYALTCTFATPTDDALHEEYCRIYDGASYSVNVTNVNYTTDSTSPTTSTLSVAGDTVASYFDTVDDSLTEIIVSGESNMACRWSTSDLAYGSMSNDCTISGIQANCSINDVASQGFTTRYVSCQDSLINEQNSTQNLNVDFFLDYTAPTTSDDSVAAVQVPNYTVTITEADNVDADPTTLFCTDTSGSCSPSLTIDDGGTITFTSSNRGINFLRYNSTDDAGNQQITTNKTININQLPVFNSANDSGAGTVASGATVTIATSSYDSDSGQEMTLWVCNSTSITSAGCVSNNYCNSTSTGNMTCSFTAETTSATYTWYAFIYDELNEISISNFSDSYIVDATIPSITVDSPTNGSTITQSSVTFTITVNEPLTNAWYSLNSGTNVTMSNTSLFIYTHTNSSIPDGNYNVTFYANDSYGNVAFDSETTFTIDTTPDDTTPPTIIITSPANASYQNPTNTLVNISGDENLEWAAYQLDDGSILDLDNTSLTSWNITLTNLSQETVYNLTIYANDTSSNQNNKTIFFYTDSLAPRYSNVQASPSPANVSQDVNCSITWTDTFNVTNVKISENSSGTDENHTISFSGVSGSVSYLIPGAQLSNAGGYTCRFYAEDSAGNANSTSVNFNVNDVTPPSITIISPLNVTYNQANISISITLSENASSAWYSLNSTANVTMDNTSLIAWNSTLTNLANGAYNIIFYVNDSSNNLGNSSTVYFGVNVAAGDTVPPIITIDTITNASYKTSTTVELNITINENSTWAGYDLNGGGLTDMSNTSLFKWNATLSGLGTESTNTLIVYANDTASPANTGNNSIVFYVDTLNPRITNISASPSPANETQDVICNAYVEDTFDLTNVKIGENSSGVFVNHTISLTSSGFMNFTISSVSKGGYTCKFYATDAAGNINSSESVNFNVNDVTSPSITINSPLNQSYSNASILFSITLDENSSYAEYSLDGGLNNVSLSGSAKSWSGTVDTGSDGSKTATFYVNDSSGNRGTNSVVFFVDATLLDTTPPTITVISPINNSYDTDGTVLLNITTDEGLAWAAWRNNSETINDMSNVSLTNWNATIVFAEGQHQITFYANDTSSNQNQANKSVTLNVDLNNPQVSTFSCSPNPANDFNDVNCSATVTDSLGLDYAIIGHNATGSWQNSSQISLSGTTSSLSYLITSGNTTPPSFTAKLYVFDNSGRTNFTESYLVNISDDTFPIFTNITYYPNTSDALDPGVAVNVNVTIIEDYNISSVILMYQNLSAGIWTSITMNNNSALVDGNISTIVYNATFTPQNGTWVFRINATDYAGNQNISANTTFDVIQDLSFFNSTSIPTIKSFTTGQAADNKTLGELFVNNTGDSALNFTINISSSIRDRFNINYTLNPNATYEIAGEGAIINLTILVNTTSLTAANYKYNLTLTSSIGTTIYENQLNIQTTLAPFLTVTINTYASSVTQGDTGLNFKATVENSGTSDATGVYLNWTLPSGLSVATGTQNRSLSSIPIDGSGTNTITVDVASDATVGTFNVTAIGTASNGDLASDTQSVVVNSLIAVAEVTPVATGGGGGGGGAAVFRPTTYSKIIEIVRGETDTFEIEVENKYFNQTLEDLTLELTGFFSQYITILTSKIDKIEYNEVGKFKVRLQIPSYIDYEEHDLIANIRGLRIINGKENNYYEIQNIKLIINEVSLNETTINLEEARKAIASMKEKDFNTKEVDELLKLAEEKLNEKRNSEAIELANEIISLKEKAFEVDDLIKRILEVLKNPRKISLITGNLAKEIVDEEGNKIPVSSLITGEVIYDTKSVEDILDLARIAFERGDYDLAEERAKSAQLLLLLETKGNFGLFLYLYWHFIAFGLFISSVGGIVCFRKYQKTSITKKIENANKEEQNIEKLIIDVQRKYFAKKISVSDYNSIVDQHQKKLVKLKNMRMNLRNKRIKLLMPQQILQNLEIEKMEVEAEIKKIQTAYYLDRSISEKEYKLQFEILNGRLAEIEGERTTLQLLGKTGKGIIETNKTFKKINDKKIKIDLKKSTLEARKKIRNWSKLKAVYLKFLGIIIIPKNYFKKRNSPNKDLIKKRDKQIKENKRITARFKFSDFKYRVIYYFKNLYRDISFNKSKRGVFNWRAN